MITASIIELRTRIFHCSRCCCRTLDSTPVGFTAISKKKFDRSLKTLHLLSSLTAVIILERARFVTSPFFKSLSLGLINYVVCIFQNKARSWQVHDAPPQWFPTPVDLSGDRRVNERSDWTLCPWRGIPGELIPSAFLSYEATSWDTVKNQVHDKHFFSF